MAEYIVLNFEDKITDTQIEYRLKGATLTVMTRYGDSATHLAPGTALYSGPLLPPG